MSKKQNVNDYLKEAIDNIREDRDVTKELLDDVLQFLAKGESTHRDVGLTAAKYVETLQRSNEQLVKISGLMLKQETKDSSVSLSDMDKDNIYDMIKES
jgi:phage-related minor tail protein|tara:strand:- start:1253 stop:1549 length:297 start_codon:yes stop_codon:yes gene_type:complete